jgi:hypothetical protein
MNGIHLFSTIDESIIIFTIIRRLIDADAHQFGFNILYNHLLCVITANKQRALTINFNKCQFETILLKKECKNFILSSRVRLKSENTNIQLMISWAKVTAAKSIKE